MPVEERKVFTGEVVLPMVAFLVADVIAELAIVEGRDGEGAIAVLPLEVEAMRKVS